MSLGGLTGAVVDRVEAGGHRDAVDVLPGVADGVDEGRFHSALA